MLIEFSKEAGNKHDPKPLNPAQFQHLAPDPRRPKESELARLQKDQLLLSVQDLGVSENRGP